MIVELGHRPDGRARRPHGIDLVNSDGRRNSLDTVDLRPIHTIEKLSCVRRKCFDVTPLTFRIKRIERERGFTRAADARHDDELVERQVDVEILEVVLPRASDRDCGAAATRRAHLVNDGDSQAAGTIG